jgi:hypothetical protein
MLTIAYCSGDFESIFDEQFLNIDGTAHRTARRLDENFMADFENINTLIYNKYMCLMDKSCPICLCDYQDDDVVKILPGWYHTFHHEWIKHWFKNQLKCPFWRIDITREQIDRDKNMNDEQLLKMIKHSESFYDGNINPSEDSVRIAGSVSMKYDQHPYINFRNTYNSNAPLQVSVEGKSNRKSMFQGRSNSQINLHGSQVDVDEPPNTDRFKEYRRDKGRESIEIEQMRKSGPTPNMMNKDPSLNSNFFVVNNEIEFAQNSNLRTPKNYEYFELSEDQN